MRLHQLNQSQYPSHVVRDFLLCLTRGDSVILIEEAVMLLAQQNSTLLNEIEAKEINWYVLDQDAEAYGIHIPLKTQYITMAQWVKLTCQSETHIAW